MNVLDLNTADDALRGQANASTAPDVMLPHLRVTAAQYGVQVFKPPFSLSFDESDACSLYLLRGAPMIFECREAFGAPVQLHGDSIVCVCGGQAHGLRDSLKTAYPSRASEPLDLSTGIALGASQKNACVITRITVSKNVFTKIFRTTPVIIVNTENRGFIARALRTTDLMNMEAFAGEDDSAAEMILFRLTEILFIALMTHWLERHAAIGTDPRLENGRKNIRCVVDAIHKAPGKMWKLKDMASLAAMNKTSFCAAFKRELHMPPMEYLTQVRMSLAVAYMCEPRHSLAEIGYRVGYQSLAAFNRAFSRHYALTPGRYRKLYCLKPGA